MVPEVRIKSLHEFYPAGAAGSDDRKRPSRLYRVHHLGTFLYDSEVRREVGVEDRVEAHSSQGRVQFSGDDCAGLHAEFLSELSSDRRRLLHDHVLLRIAEGFPDLSGLTLLIKGAYGTEDGTLTAVDADAVAQTLIKGGAYA